MSIKKIFTSKKGNKLTEEEKTIKDAEEKEMEQLRAKAREMSWAYTFLPPTGFTGGFWHYF